MNSAWRSIQTLNSHRLFNKNGRLVGEALWLADRQLWDARVAAHPYEPLVIGQYESLTTAQTAIEKELNLNNGAA